MIRFGPVRLTCALLLLSLVLVEMTPHVHSNADRLQPECAFCLSGATASAVDTAQVVSPTPSAPDRLGGYHAAPTPATPRLPFAIRAPPLF